MESQLKRTQTTLNKLNKSLNLRAKVQTIKLDTRAANTQIKNLEQRINRLGRTVTINVRQNEKPGKGGSAGGSNVTAVVGGGAAESLVAAKALRPISKALTDEAQKQLDLEKARATAVEKLVDNKQKEAAAQERLSKAVGKQDKLLASKNNVTAANYFGAGTTRESGLKQIGAEIRNAETSLRNLRGIQDRFKGDVVETTKAYQELTGEIKRSEQAVDKAAAKAARNADRRKRAGKGALAGAGVAGLRIPGLEGASAGGLAGFAVGGKTGGAVGAAVGLTADLLKGLVSATLEVTKFNNQLRLSQKALANTVNTSEELALALAAVETISDDFVVPIGDATKQFTKLNAAARASGFGVKEVEEVYRGLAAANVALGGDAERLNGILLATQQVFSKGKVQAEELRGQIGERLAGAFAKFAEATGKSTKELDKALEQGEVSLDDFVKFSKSLLAEYEDDAKKLADAPENAAARLKQSMDDLKRAMGPILASIGNAFIELANTVVQQITRMANAINSAFIGQARANFQGQRRAAVNFQQQKNEADQPGRRGNGFGQVSQREYDIILENLSRTTKGAEEAWEALQRLENPTAGLEPSGKPLKPKEVQTLGGDTDTKSKGGGRTPAGPRDRTAELRVELDLQQKLNDLQNQSIVGTSRQVEDNQRMLAVKTLLVEADAEKQRIALENTTAESKKLANLLVEKQLENDLNAITLERAQIEFDRNEELRISLRGLQEQIDVEGALTDEMKLQAEWAARIAELTDQYPDPERRAQAEAKLNQLYSQRLALLDPLVQYQRELQVKIGDTRGQIASLARTVESELGSALSNAITGLIDGTTTVQEAFSNMFANIGKAFIDMATQMLAQKAVLALLGAFTGGSGPQPGDQFGNLFTGIRGKATGGPVDRNTPYIVGERGPELFIPGASGSITNNQQFEAARASMSYYGGSGGANGGTGTFRLETTVINGVEYATVEQVRAMGKSSAREGAAAGNAKTMNSLRNSRSQRSKIGLR